mmetsp:Transcript_60491/g.70752  ORF Transcript_60491/g.70752 Transcript_60491/m.70752 type:complete len:90 (+) Transcript_60491:155-424(+)
MNTAAVHCLNRDDDDPSDDDSVPKPTLDAAVRHVTYGHLRWCSKLGWYGKWSLTYAAGYLEPPSTIYLDPMKAPNLDSLFEEMIVRWKT